MTCFQQSSSARIKFLSSHKITLRFPAEKLRHYGNILLSITNNKSGTLVLCISKYTISLHVKSSNSSRLTQRRVTVYAKSKLHIEFPQNCTYIENDLHTQFSGLHIVLTRNMRYATTDSKNFVRKYDTDIFYFRFSFILSTMWVMEKTTYWKAVSMPRYESIGLMSCGNAHIKGVEKIFW